MEKIVIVGCGGHARSVLDAVRSMGTYEIAGFVDRERNEAYQCCGYGIIGTDADLQALYDSGVHNACIGIGYMGEGDIRRRLYEELKQKGFALPAVVDATAALAADVRPGEGAFIGKNAVVNTCAAIGRAAIVNSGAIVEHDCAVGDFAHIAVGAVLCGGVTVGDDAFVGANATVVQGIRIGCGAVIGAGAAVIRDIEDRMAAAGVPARALKKIGAD